MFPIAHAWLLTRLVPEPPLAGYLGCIWPDMLFESPMTHKESHHEGLRLVEHLRAMAPGAARDEFRAFVVGALSHGSEPHGFDWLSDESWGGRPLAEKGYAFQRGRVIASAAARACGVAEEQGLWKAHNFVEMAFERTLYDANPALGDSLAAACTDDALTRRIGAVLADIFPYAADALVSPMRLFPEVAALRPADHGIQAEFYAMQVRLKHLGSQPDVVAIATLIGSAEEIVAGDRDAYLATAEREVGAMLRAVLDGEGELASQAGV